jgi:hypothetical protein
MTDTVEAVCDTCGVVDHYMGNQESTIEQARSNGWIVTFDKMTFCSGTCYREPATFPEGET